MHPSIKSEIRKFYPILIVLLLMTIPLNTAGGVTTATFDIEVDRLDDDPSASACTSASNDCSLRGAVSYANTAAYGSIVNITIPAGTYPLTTTGAGENNNATGDLDFTRNTVTLTGAGRSLTVLDGQFTDRVIDNQVSTLTVEDLTIQGGRVVTGENGGGGIINRGGRTMNLDNVYVQGNAVSGNSQYVDNGGGVANYGHLMTVATAIDNNTACNGGGIVSTNAWLIMDHTSMTGNEARPDDDCGDGGGLATISNGKQFELSNVTISANTGVRGGGIFFNVTGGQITDSYIHDNIASSNGGGLYNYGTLILERVTLANNQADGNGGGIGNSEILTLLNVTISNNNAIYGGGIYNTGGSTITMDHCTIAGNTAPIAGTAYYGWTGSITSLHNSIFAGAVTGKTWGNPGAITTTDLGFNLCSDDTCPLAVENHDLIGYDPLLGLMGYFGGSTPTMPLLPASPAIDSADPIPSLATDQRGFPRVDGNRDGSILADIGAFEYSPLIWIPLIVRSP